MKNYRGSTCGEWVVGEYLDRGGNAVVYHATRNDEKGAIKILHGSKPEAVFRFKHEIEALQQCQDIPGVIPLLDADADGSPRWIVMALAEGNALDVLARNETDLSEVIVACAQVAETLAKMHERGISHRDIKPSNLLFLDGAWLVGDFGLVNFDGKPRETKGGKKLGPADFLPHEMLENPDTADGKAADVFCFVKTLWVLAAKRVYPFQGQYDPTNDDLSLRSLTKDPSASTLDRIIEAGATYVPEKRLAMNDVVKELAAWLHPPSATGGASFDLSKYAAEIKAINDPAVRQRATAVQAKETQSRERQRLRELFLPVQEHFVKTLSELGFLGCTGTANGEFCAQAGLMSIPYEKEIVITLEGRIRLDI